MKIANVIIAMLLTLSTSAFAHPDHDEAPLPTIKLEASQSAAGVTLHLTDKGVKVATAGASGRLVWMGGTAKGEAALTPSGDNTMEAKGAKPPVGSKMQASITFANKSVFTGDVTAK